MRRQLSTVAIALSVIFMLGGCGEESQGDGVASAGGANTAAPSGEALAADLSGEDRAQRFAQCMRDNGVDVPDPDPNAPGGPGLGGAAGKIDRDSPVFQQARTACQDKLPQGRGRQGGK